MLGKGPGKRCAGDEVVTQDLPKFSWKHKPPVRVRRKYTQKVPRPWGEKEHRIQQFRQKEGRLKVRSERVRVTSRSEP